MINAANTPIKDTDEIDFKAGCLANTNAPIAKIVVRAAKMIEIRYVFISFFPVVYSFYKTLGMKILKSTACPKINVQTIKLKMLS